MEPCGAPHPERPEMQCQAVGTHADHIHGLTLWPNTAFKPTVQSSRGRRQTMTAADHDQLRKLTERARAAVHETLDSAGPLARRSDPVTSHLAADGLPARVRGQKLLLLAAYAEHPDGLTDDEAAVHAGLFNRPGCCWWHRCSDLRSVGAVVDTGMMRAGSSGEQRMVSCITEDGRRLLEGSS